MINLLSWITDLFNLILTPFQSVNPIWPLFLLSLVVGIFMLLIYRLTSNQKEILEMKNRIKGHLIEIRLFKDNLPILLSAQKKIFLYNLRYMKCAIVPMLFMIIPIAVVLIELNDWFGYRPLRSGESAILAVTTTASAEKLLPQIALEAGEGITVETSGIVIPDKREIDWRLRGGEAGEHRLVLRVADRAFEKKVMVSNGKLVRTSPARVSTSNLWDTFLYPGERPFADNPWVERIEIRYPSRSIAVLGWNLNWIVVFFILSLVFGLAFKGFLKVEI